MESIGYDIKMTNFKVAYQWNYSFYSQLYTERIERMFHEPYCFVDKDRVYGVIIVVDENDRDYEFVEYNPDKARIIIKMKDEGFHNGSIYLLEKEKNPDSVWACYYKDIAEFVNKRVHWDCHNRTILAWHNPQFDDHKEVAVEEEPKKIWNDIETPTRFYAVEDTAGRVRWNTTAVPNNVQYVSIRQVADVLRTVNIANTTSGVIRVGDTILWEGQPVVVVA